MGTLDELINQANASEVEMDFSEAETFEALEGSFPIVVTDVVQGTAASGNPKVVFHLLITEGEKKGRKLQKHCPTRGKGSGITLGVLSALGFDVAGDRFSLKMSEAIGRTAVAVCRPSKNREGMTDVQRLEADSSVPSSGL